MSEQGFAFGSFRLLCDQQVLLLHGQPVALGGRALDILKVLVERPGEIVAKDELIARVWPDGVVDDANLRVHIAALRKALGDRDTIKSVIGRGYCFVAPVKAAPQVAPRAAAPPVLLQGRLTRVIGRDETVAALGEQLARHRVITIVGPGGIGKTTVGLAVAEMFASNYADGIRFVDLAASDDPGRLVASVAAALDVAARDDVTIADLIAALRHRAMLVVLDNCEHLIEPAAALVEAIHAGAPGLHLIVTSREPLRVSGEWVHRLESLDSPAESEGLTLAAAMDYSAIRLFVERASASWATFVPTEEDVPFLVTICRRLDGIPLALELAAGRVDSLGLRTMADSLNGRYSLIMRGRRTAVPRHQTLRSMLDFSYNCLSEREQALLRRVGVFTTAVSLEALVAMAPGLAPAQAIETVASLVAKSLLGSEVGGRVARYRLLRTTRIYALEKLREAGEEAEVHRLHAELVLAQLSAPAGGRAEMRATDDQWQAELRAATDWAAAQRGEAALAARLSAAAVALRQRLSQTQPRERAAAGALTPA